MLDFGQGAAPAVAPDSVSQGYLTEAAPKADSPEEQLYKALADQSKGAATATAPGAIPLRGNDNPTPGAPAGFVGPGPAPTGAQTQTQSAPRGDTTLGAGTPASGGTPAGPGVGGPASPDSIALLARLAPMGITSLDQLKGKTDVELHKLSVDTVSHENRETQMTKYFFKNPDGSYDLSRGPDGQPNGLDPQGRPLPTGGAATTPPTAPPKAVPPKTAPNGQPLQPNGHSAAYNLKHGLHSSGRPVVRPKPKK